MIIGYSFWGFLGPGVADTPDGGRSHRRPFLQAIVRRGHRLALLQADRDRDEAGSDVGDAFTFDPGLPELDVLFLEWRWPIPGRNTTACGTPGHTCDMHRQAELLAHYTRRKQTPTIVSDKDRQLPRDALLRHHVNVVICEAALIPADGAQSLLFPVEDTQLDQADPAALAARQRHLTLAYVGNQYDRDDAFERYFAPAAAQFPHLVAGKWTRTARWPQVRFAGRIPFTGVAGTYGSALATVLLLPQRYETVGQMTQRIFEAVLSGCLPITPDRIRHPDLFSPHRLHVSNGTDVISLLAHLTAITGTPAHERLIAECVRKLELFRLSAQMKAFDRILAAAAGARAMA
jgi:hypothetical protein